MRYRVDAPITATEERAQYPTDQANQDRAPKSAPEAVDVKSGHETWHPEQHQGVDDEDEKAKRNEDQRRA